MAAELLKGAPIAERIRAEVGADVAALKEQGITPSLVALQVGENPASAVYVGQQQKTADKLGISYRLEELPAESSQKFVADFIGKLNTDPSVTGIILQMPVPEGLNARALQALIDPAKDVEGVSPANMGWVVFGRPVLAPCTALGVVELINSTGVDLYGKEVVVVGHSDIVGKPVALLLVDKFATTTICHIGTGERGVLPDHVKRAEILVVAVGKAGLIKGEWVKEGAIVVDVGINRVGDKLVGDVEFEPAAERAAYITPVPGGVGPLTVTILMKNTVAAAKQQKGIE
ncbi:MAG: bifunctional 5,10-methylenetetrahydrofolate dehydrogenase/5,10-methenyltetrahydrofolate cyclohydrolase [Armatimonadota bacterium]|nr:MAG: bifunctional 5,10-methylenetetrahydrofolate dehydrogenase/5,10-methenyltetrahydrofolate cyclohydrolase [Armatimonadota bacterium]